MTKSWRPEGWRSSYRVVTTTLSDETNKTRFLENRAYEAGADAMLKALRETLEVRGAEMAYRAMAEKNNHPYYPPMLGGQKGKWVFIPDEE